MKTHLLTILLIFQSLYLPAQTNDEKEKFMKMAIELSMQGADGNASLFGAVVVRDGVVIGKGFNITATAHDPTAHGEVNAIRDACKNIGSLSLEGCDLYSNAEPCPMCFGAAYWANIKNIYYGVSAEDLDATGIGIELYRQICLQYAERNIKFEQVLRNDAQKVFDDNMVK